MVFSVTCVIVSLFWGIYVISYFKVYVRLHKWPTTSLLVSPHDTWRSNAFTNILAWVCSIMLWGICLCYTMVYKLTKVSHKWSLTLVCSRISSSCIVERKQMSLVISILTNIFFLHTKHKTSSQVSQMCYGKCHDMIVFLLKKLLMLMNTIILAIDRHETLIPLDI